MKIRTNLRGLWGSEVITSAGTLAFNDEGVATVSEEMGSNVIELFPKNYFLDGEEDPRITEVRDAAAVASEAAPAVEMSSFDETAASTFDESSLVEDDADALVEDEAAAEKEEEVVEEEEKEVEENSATESDTTESDVRAELKNLNVKELKALLKDSGVEYKEYSTLKEDQLIDMIIEKNII